MIDSPMCACGLNVENEEHYSLYCPLYLRCCNRLFTSIVQQTPLSIDAIDTELLLVGSPKLLYDVNSKLFKLVHMYLEETERFI
jgi:hypothetical protein